MKYISFFIICMLPASFLVKSQVPFQGRIIYRLHSSDSEDDGQLTLSLGKNVVKFQLSDKNGPDKQELLVRLDSGKVYTLRPDEKTFSVNSLFERANEMPVANIKKIAGMTVSPVIISPSDPLAFIFGQGMYYGSVIVYVSDSLYYPVPEKYAINPQFAFSRNDHIVLGIIMKSEKENFDGYSGDPIRRSANEISAEAISIVKETINESEFMIPVGYTKYDYNMLMSDSTVALDSVYLAPTPVDIKPEKPPVKSPTDKKPSSKPAKKTPNKEMRKPGN